MTAKTVHGVRSRPPLPLSRTIGAEVLTFLQLVTGIMAHALAVSSQGVARRKYAKDHARRLAALPVRQHDLKGHRCPDRLAVRLALGVGPRKFPGRLHDRRRAGERGASPRLLGDPLA